jgi:hypothetical protein
MPKLKKRLLPWSNLPQGAFPKAWLKIASIKTWVDDQEKNALPPIDIPRCCHDSQKRAWDLLINRACKMPADEFGHLDPDKYHLDIVEARGTAFGDGGLRQFLGGHVTVILKEKRGQIPQFGLALANDSIWEDEKRLNRFLKKLGRTLENAKKKQGQTNTTFPYAPDWEHNTSRFDQLVVQGWCERIIVDDEQWPPLCCLTHPALFDFLKLCKNPVISKSNSDLEAFRQRIRRLKLISIPKGRLRFVEKRENGQFIFA